MKAPGQVALVRFPFSDQTGAKLRPVLLVCRAPGRHDDWLVCMISSRLVHAVPEFDGAVSAERLRGIRGRLASWLSGGSGAHGEAVP